MTGLRERKKLQTRYAIISTAVRLFSEHGYEETTVAEIAEAAEVAPRTFFRYFATKDDVALSLIAEIDETVFPALDARPAGEPPVTALGNAMRHTIERLMENDDETGELWLRIQQLVESSPPLLGAYFRRMMSIDDRLARRLAEREGVDPDTDMRPFLAVGLVNTALRTAHQRWCTMPGATREDLFRLRDGALSMLQQPLDYHWAG